MDSMRECSSIGLLNVISVFKNMMTIIQILVPIILLIFTAIGLFKLMMNPDDKKLKKGIINKFIAALIVFFVPTIINTLLNILGTNTNLSTCWTLSDNYSITNKATYKRINETRKPSTILTDPSDYEKGEPKSSACGEKIARLAVEVAGTATPEHFIKSPDGRNYCAFNKSNDPRLSRYNQIHDSRVSCNHAYASCTQAAATVIDAAADPEINWMGPAAQWYYLEHSSKWEEITLGPGQKWSDVLQPGDVGETMWDSSSGHSWIYVGNELVREKFPNSTGNLYQAGYSSCKNPHIDDGGSFVNSSNTSYHYFRFIGDCSEAETVNVKDGYGGPKAYNC